MLSAPIISILLGVFMVITVIEPLPGGGDRKTVIIRQVLHPIDPFGACEKERLNVKGEWTSAECVSDLQISGTRRRR